MKKINNSVKIYHTSNPHNSNYKSCKINNINKQKSNNQIKSITILQT